MPASLQPNPILHASRRTVILYLLGSLYSFLLITLLLWALGFILIFYASRLPRTYDARIHVRPPPPPLHLRFKHAFFWMSEYDPTPRTLQYTSWIMYFYFFTFMIIVLGQPYSLGDLPWDGWVFMEANAALGITVLVMLVAAVRRVRMIPRGEMVEMACDRCFQTRRVVK